jgi:hypothetical protein
LKGTVLFLLIFVVKSAKQVPFTIHQSDLNIEKRVSKQTGVKKSVRSRVCWGSGADASILAHIRQCAPCFDEPKQLRRKTKTKSRARSRGSTVLVQRSAYS